MSFVLDLHMHTISSGHAYSTLNELVDEAVNKELKMIGISDHAPAMPGGPHIYYFNNLRVVPNEIKGIRVLKGVEANIINHNGDIDMGMEDIMQLDYAIASMHPPCLSIGSKKENTEAALKTMENPYVNIIGHPDDTRFLVDYKELVIGAKANNVLLEINNASLNPKGFRLDTKKATKEILKWSMTYNHPVILGSDAHISYDVGNFKYCIDALDELDFPKELIVNTSVDKVLELFASKKA